MQDRIYPPILNRLGWFITLLSVMMVTVRAESVVPAEIFDPGYLEGDSNYHCLTAASDGYLYFAVNSHHPGASVRIYRFDTSTDTTALVGDVSAALGLEPAREIVHGKIHTPLVEWDGYLYFATHTSQYDGNLPLINPPDGRQPYAGGHFMRLNLATQKIEDVAALGLPNEGLITMAVDKPGRTLYGLTWPSAQLVSFNLDEGRLKNWGAVQQRGEWGAFPDEWDFVCRKLGVTPEGTVYGSTNTGRIWHFDSDDQRPVKYFTQLNLDAVPPIQAEDFTIEPVPHFFWRNWRTLIWNDATASFWGLHGGSGQLFEFTPATGTLRSVRPLNPTTIVPGRRNPFRTQLGFMLGPDNTLLYLAHAPPTPSTADRAVATSVHLLTYAIDTDTFTDHGAITGPDHRRIFFTESIALGPDDHLYSVAWVETTDPAKMQQVQTARAFAAPEETQDIIFEIQLIRLPRRDALTTP
ncbi:hypothetical protein [Synoicihabitans lomoniglobus]|uniref:Uncharacterized protein n=1 Tax=Synoicihabitans lomoniglobus TaxID=2909285 RepID=A0AAE9ZYA9_9BACT|nr:hypothetical protein [Opitutaceae bacterium LMO-M01]WED65589.1 hypothetical protein PXH66_01830 [Opitutaceae bacterium LMO-M01]